MVRRSRIFALSYLSVLSTALLITVLPGTGHTSSLISGSYGNSTLLAPANTSALVAPATTSTSLQPASTSGTFAPANPPVMYYMPTNTSTVVQPQNQFIVPQYLNSNTSALLQPQTPSGTSTTTTPTTTQSSNFYSPVGFQPVHRTCMIDKIIIPVSSWTLECGPKPGDGDIDPYSGENCFEHDNEGWVCICTQASPMRARWECLDFSDMPEEEEEEEEDPFDFGEDEEEEEEEEDEEDEYDYEELERWLRGSRI